MTANAYSREEARGPWSYSSWYWTREPTQCRPMDKRDIREFRRWHRDKLGDPWQALDPDHNLQVGARILATCYRERRDRWDAVGCYHAPNNRKFANRYRRNVAAHWRRITQRG